MTMIRSAVWAKALATGRAVAMLFALVALAAAGCGGGAVGPGGAVEQAAPGGGVDQAIKAAVEMSLRTDPRTQSSAIQVTVSGRAVTLTGEAATGEAKVAAVELAGKVADVAQVFDRMTVKTGGLP